MAVRRFTALLVGLDAATAAVLQASVQDRGIDAFASSRGSALRALALLGPDMVVVQPGTDNDLLAAVRGQHTGPILATGPELPAGDVARLIDMGGIDDYCPESSPEVLAAKMGALLRGRAAGGASVVVGGLALDRARRVVLGPAGDLALTPKEFLLLEYLSLRRGQIVPYDALLDEIWRSKPHSLHRLAVTMCRLRHRLEAIGTIEIETVAGVGYALHVRADADTEEALTPTTAGAA